MYSNRCYISLFGLIITQCRDSGRSPWGRSDPGRETNVGLSPTPWYLLVALTAWAACNLLEPSAARVAFMMIPRAFTSRWGGRRGPVVFRKTIRLRRIDRWWSRWRVFADLGVLRVMAINAVAAHTLPSVFGYAHITRAASRVIAWRRPSVAFFCHASSASITWTDPVLTARRADVALGRRRGSTHGSRISAQLGALCGSLIVVQGVVACGMVRDNDDHSSDDEKRAESPGDHARGKRCVHLHVTE